MCVLCRYIDILHDEWDEAGQHRQIGQPKLPLMLPLAGSTFAATPYRRWCLTLTHALLPAGGTFFSPFYLDSNDVLVRAVAKTPGLDSFIDEPWVDFVAELNSRARLVSRTAVERTVGSCRGQVAACPTALVFTACVCHTTRAGPRSD